MSKKLTRNDIIRIANARYPDGFLAQYWDFRKCCINDDGDGDGLASFIVHELMEPFDPAASNYEKLSEAARVLGRATDELTEVGFEFSERLYNEVRLVRKRNKERKHGQRSTVKA